MLAAVPGAAERLQRRTMGRARTIGIVSLVLSFLVTWAPPPAVSAPAIPGALRFSLSLASGPGMQTLQVSSVDPCPAPPAGSVTQTVFVSTLAPASTRPPLPVTGTVPQYRPSEPPVPMIAPVTATVRSDGSWSTTVTIPAQPSGPVTLVADCLSQPGTAQFPGGIQYASYELQPFLETTSGNGYWLAETAAGSASPGAFDAIGFGDAGNALAYGYDGNIAPEIKGSTAALAPYPLTGAGYWFAGGTNGGVVPGGDAPFFNSGQSFPHLLNAPVVGIAATPDGKGYWLAASDGGVFGFGDAAFLGSAEGLQLNGPVVGIAATPDGGGYWLATSDGGVFAYGDARYVGSAGSAHLNKPIVGIAATPDGQGYWLVASDGGVFGYGDAGFYGSAGGRHLNKPIMGIAHSADGHGYWLAAADGGIFAYGDAPFLGSGVGLSSLTTTSTATYSAIAASPVTSPLTQPVGAGPAPVFQTTLVP